MPSGHPCFPKTHAGRRLGEAVSCPLYPVSCHLPTTSASKNGVPTCVMISTTTSATSTVKLRAPPAERRHTACCHTYRSTGSVTYLQNCGRIGQAQRITNYESSRKTKFYDRTNDAIRSDCNSLAEIERILIWSADLGEAESGSGARGFAAAPRCR